MTCDADLVNLAHAAIPLDLLQEWFSRIPASRLILLLDCCFSSGMGAKVLLSDVKARDPGSTEARLEEFAGKGRIILTAPSAH